MKKEDAGKAAPIRERLEKYVTGKSFGFNPDSKTVDTILGAMAKKKEKFGEEYCPCRVLSGDKKKDADIICPCIYHLAELEADGFCHCHLFTTP